MTIKHIPQRTCVACRKKKDKQALIRLVRVADGTVEVDPGERKTGRGAYLCPARECWEAGLKTGRLEYALRTNLTQEKRGQLIQYLNDLAGVIGDRGK
jgi:predicted RNA-binding protein YlxR (DUF448 family)